MEMFLFAIVSVLTAFGPIFWLLATTIRRYKVLAFVAVKMGSGFAETSSLAKFFKQFFRQLKRVYAKEGRSLEKEKLSSLILILLFLCFTGFLMFIESLWFTAKERHRPRRALTAKEKKKLYSETTNGIA
jgi:hypothetical protein